MHPCLRIKGQLGTRAGVLYSEAVRNWEVYNFHLKNLFYTIQKMYFRHEMCEHTVIHRSVIDNSLFSRAVPEDNDNQY